MVRSRKAARRAAARKGWARRRAAARARSAAARAGWRTRRVRAQVETAKRAARVLGRAEKRRAVRKVSEVARAVAETEEWEVTIRYSKAGEVSDVTVRVTAPRGASRDSILGALWRARRGGTLTTMHVEGVDWRHGGQDHHYGAEALQADGFGALLKHSLLRVELVR